jgi:hypothetical protein
MEFLTNETKREKDLIRVRRLKVLRGALVGFSIYRIIIWMYWIIKLDTFLNWEPLYDYLGTSCSDTVIESEC